MNITPEQGAIGFLIVLVIGLGAGLVYKLRSKRREESAAERIAGNNLTHAGFVKSGEMVRAHANGDMATAEVVFDEIVTAVQTPEGTALLQKPVARAYITNQVATPEHKRQVHKFGDIARSYGFDHSATVLTSLAFGDFEALEKAPEFVRSLVESPEKMDAEAKNVALHWLQMNADNTEKMKPAILRIAEVLRSNTALIRSEEMWGIARAFLEVVTENEETCDRFDSMYKQIHASKCDKLPLDELDIIRGKTTVRLKKKEIPVTNFHQIDTRPATTPIAMRTQMEVIHPETGQRFTPEHPHEQIDPTTMAAMQAAYQREQARAAANFDPAAAAAAAS